MEMINQIQSYSTADVYLAATLYALGSTIAAIDKANDKRCLFVFENSEELIAKIESFWRKELLVEPQTLFTALKSLK